MSTFRITKIENFKNYSFGERLIDIVTALSLPTPFIRGSEMTKLHKKGIWVIYIMQPGCETEPKTEKIKFKTFHTNKKIGTQLLMQEIIAHLCGRHFSELQNHYSHSYGRRDEEGMVIGLTDSCNNPNFWKIEIKGFIKIPNFGDNKNFDFKYKINFLSFKTCKFEHLLPCFK
jgi:hypothetical protein